MIEAKEIERIGLALGTTEKEERLRPHISVMRDYRQNNPFTPAYDTYPYGIDSEGFPHYYANKRAVDPRTRKPFPFVDIHRLKWYSRQPERKVPPLDQFPGPLTRLRNQGGEKKRKGAFVPDAFRHCTPTALVRTESFYTRVYRPYVKRPVGKM